MPYTSAMIRALAIAALLSFGASCKGGGNGNTTTGGGNVGGGGNINAECGELADTVRRLYRGETTGNPELDADLLEANVQMVLADCSTDPDKYVGCIRRSVSIAALERDCLIPLDDEGTVEAKQFR